jgi:Raf kinase inhibitor-like YbhB/YbcL family protein
MTKGFFVLMLVLAAPLVAQVPPPPPSPTVPPGQQPGAPAQPGRGGGRGGRGPIQVMTLTTPAWTDGGQIPARHAQIADELSPPLSWSGAPEGTVSFALIVHDLDAMTNPPTDYTAPVRDTNDVLHWLLWNIPATATGLPEGVPQGPQLPDGSRQISQTGPYYRGPAAPATGPPHHYVFELYALDTTINVPNTDASPAEVRAAVKAAMATHVRGKATLVGLYKR